MFFMKYCLSNRHLGLFPAMLFLFPLASDIFLQYFVLEVLAVLLLLRALPLIGPKILGPNFPFFTSRGLWTSLTGGFCLEPLVERAMKPSKRAKNRSLLILE